MQAILLAAGQGTRMRPLTDDRPKPMLPVAEKPLLAHVADAAVAGGADQLVVVVGYEAHEVRNYFGSEYQGVPVEYAVQERQAGTADAVAAAREHIDDTFAVLNGDNLYDAASVADLLSGGPAVGAIRVENPSNYGVLSTSEGTVTDVVEKPDDPPTNLANTGAYVFPAEAREWLEVPESERGEHEITDVLARVVDAHDVRVVEVERWLDVGRPWELLEANEWKLTQIRPRIEGTVHEDAELRGDVVVAPDAHVEAGVVIEGPAIVGAGARVGPNAYVRGGLVGESAKVGHAVEVKNSILMEGAQVPHQSYVGDSILGRDVNFGAGTQVANLRHDDEPVEMTVKGERVSTGRRKFGVVVGHDVKTGIETSLAPGVVLSPGAWTGPGETVSRDR